LTWKPLDPGDQAARALAYRCWLVREAVNGLVCSNDSWLGCSSFCSRNTRARPSNSGSRLLLLRCVVCGFGFSLCSCHPGADIC
jgi:hypothetical protein